MYIRKTPRPASCQFNDGVACRVQLFCDKCNWNPNKRMAAKEEADYEQQTTAQGGSET